MLEVGDIAPEIKLPNQDGLEVGLSDFDNKWVVVYFYPKDDTPGCTIQACGFNQALSDVAFLDAIVLGISPDDEASHQKFITKYALRFSLLCDKYHDTMKAYDAWGMKNVFGVKKEGVKRSTYIINPDGKIVKIYKNVVAKGHVDIVLEDLKKLKSSK